ncbi:carboxypeptidase regulatory-like domain-containing protein [Porphyromonas sp.]|uniref:carboxypeptidase regulatory-like domain-containing protein n=1 Tax=Porphyromonas sp. TaxID=1924944 RepID=UPI0025F74CAF|nr:carboxypeptidase regulatory-like domain-containing protein [Porphyromonas sp.]
MEHLLSTLIRKALLVTGLLLVALTTSAQTTGGAITGTIRNAEGVLEGASVFLVKDRETQEIVQFAVSDAAGRFTMNAPAGNYIFGVSYLGYAMHTEEISLTAEPLDLGIITLETSAEELQTVVVRGQIVGVRTQPDGFTVDVHEIRERSNDALDLLKHIGEGQPARHHRQGAGLGQDRKCLAACRRLGDCRSSQGLRCGADRPCGGHHAATA